MGDAKRVGRPRKLADLQMEPLRARIGAPPDRKKDGVGRWRAADVQRLMQREYGVRYSGITSVCALLHRPGPSGISGRPKHPAQEKNAVESFTKTHAGTGKNRRRASR